MLANIPGLPLVVDNDDNDDDNDDPGIQIPTFSGSITFPGKARYGILRPRDDFEKLDVIYNGRFGKFYKCKDTKKGEIHTLKKFIFPDEMKEGIPVNFLLEINILKLVQHFNIVNLVAVVAGEILESNFLLLEYCIISLQSLIEKKCDAIYESNAVKYMMKEMFNGINYIHQCTVVHRNISCGSILFTESLKLKIGGFRNSTFYSKENMTPVESDVTYKAPELLFKAKHYGYPVDIWAIGCIFAKLLLKKPIFTGNDESEVLTSIFSVLGTPNENIWPGFEEFQNTGSFEEKKFSKTIMYSNLKGICSKVPELSYELLQDLLIYYPAARLTASEVLQKNSYFKTVPEKYPSEEKASILQAALSSSISEVL